MIAAEKDRRELTLQTLDGSSGNSLGSPRPSGNASTPNFARQASSVQTAGANGGADGAQPGLERAGTIGNDKLERTGTYGKDKGGADSMSFATMIFKRARVYSRIAELNLIAQAGGVAQKPIDGERHVRSFQKSCPLSVRNCRVVVQAQEARGRAAGHAAHLLRDAAVARRGENEDVAHAQRQWRLGIADWLGATETGREHARRVGASESESCRGRQRDKSATCAVVGSKLVKCD